jgi:RHS repeat-associated protein
VAGRTQAGPAYESTATYTYDAGNRLTQAVDSTSGTIALGHDNLDRLTSETTPQGTVNYTYDAAGHRSTMVVAGQPIVNYTYDAANRLTVSQGTSTVAFSYDGAGRRTSLTLPNGITVNYSYDTTSQLTGLAYSLGTTALGSLSYGYDNNGLRTSTAGSYARTGLPNPITTTAYNASNELTTWGTANLSYDANGNLTSDGVNSYSWDARNQLASMSGSANANFLYDPLGRRVSKTIGGVTTGFLYDGFNVAQELSGSTPTANLLTGGIDEIFTRTGASVENFLTDTLGNTVATTDATGALATQYTYEPFGNATSTGPTSSNALQYTGRENDGTGLYFYRTRYYSPRLQRFISQDPIGFAGGDTNLYAYIFNSPTNYFDPIGQFGWPVHERITKDALQRAGLPPDPAMAQQVAAVDFRPGSQGPDADATNTHAMGGMTTGRKPHRQKCDEAYQGTQNQIAQDFNSGDFTKALHTIQDAYSPSHYPFRFWDGGYTPLHIPGPGHMEGDFFPPESVVEAATNASTQFLRDILDHPNGPIDPRKYLPTNPCGN